MKKIINVLVVLIISIPMFAQTEYYYFKGQRIPLTVNPKKVNVISMANGPQFAPAANPNALPTGLEVEAVISGNHFNMCIIENKTLNSLHFKNYINSIKNNYIVQPCYYNARGKELIPSGYVYVKLKQTSDSTLLYNIAQTYGLKISHRNHFMPLWHVLYISNNSVVTVANTLNELGVFDVVEPDLHYSYLQPFNSISWDENVSQQWGLYNATNDAIDINASSAWNIATGKGVKIAIVDTGVDLSHQDLAANIYPYSCDTELIYSSMPSQLYDKHGTHVAGIAAAVRNNGLQVAGVAPDAQIMSVSNQLMFSDMMTKKLAYGINWAWRNGADVINCSWFSYNCEMLADAIMQALENGRSGKGCIVVFAAGNTDGAITYPGSLCPEILTVGALSPTGEKADFSCYGLLLDVVAPGDQILSTIPNDEIEVLRGTSMAAPYVAGIAALILERNPDLTRQQVCDIIERNTTKVGSEEYRLYIDKPNGIWNSKRSD